MTKESLVTLPNPEKLRELASWYREFAERAGNPAIWNARLRTAEDLETEAKRVELLAATGP
ncbi:MAG TPA: hypothetical protein VME45_19020 [Stellaceae bacterium]|nr:hypothetical protein [Stellaceae bacterium]